MPTSKKIRILAIETSCDETAISIIEASGGLKAPRFKVLAQAISSQVKLHAAWGGVVPNLAKREHEKNFTPLLEQALREAKLSKPVSKMLNAQRLTLINKYLVREPELAKLLIPFLQTIKVPRIDVIAVTTGPGLEPALWVGINAARALAAAWELPLVPTNHMEGHIYSTLLKSSDQKKVIRFPAIALLISGGHTELVLIKDYLKYKIIGATRDDAVGEAFDKVARILGLPYPGGPEISKLAEIASKTEEISSSATFPHRPGARELISSGLPIKLPRPMLHSGDFDFSFSGLKTSVLYKVRELEKIGKLSQEMKAVFAREFQAAVVEVLTKKSLAAIKKYKTKTLIIGGGVIANKALRKSFEQITNGSLGGSQGINLLVPDLGLTGDNATMIAAAASLRLWSRKKTFSHHQKITARGDLSLK